MTLYEAKSYSVAPLLRLSFSAAVQCLEYRQSHGFLSLACADWHPRGLFSPAGEVAMAPQYHSVTERDPQRFGRPLPCVSDSLVSRRVKTVQIAGDRLSAELDSPIFLSSQRILSRVGVARQPRLGRCFGPVLGTYCYAARDSLSLLSGKPTARSRVDRIPHPAFGNNL